MYCSQRCQRHFDVHIISLFNLRHLYIINPTNKSFSRLSVFLKLNWSTCKLSSTRPPVALNYCQFPQCRLTSRYETHYTKCIGLSSASLRLPVGTKYSSRMPSWNRYRLSVGSTTAASRRDIIQCSQNKVLQEIVDTSLFKRHPRGPCPRYRKLQHNTQWTHA